MPGIQESVSAQDAVAPATPAGAFPIATARAEGAGFPVVTAGDAVAAQATVSGIPLVAQAAPEGSRFSDVDAHDDAAPANPRGAYPLGVARATSGVAFPTVGTDGDASTETLARSGIVYMALAAEDGTRAASVGRNDAAAPANLDIASVGGKVVTATPAITDGDYSQLHHNTEGSLFVVTRASSSETTIIGPVALGIGAKSAIAATTIGGFVDVGLIVSADADTDIDILLGENAARVGYWTRVSLISAQNERIVSISGLPLWANQVQVRSSAAATVTVSVERSR